MRNSLLILFSISTLIYLSPFSAALGYSGFVGKSLYEINENISYTGEFDQNITTTVAIRLTSLNGTAFNSVTGAVNNSDHFIANITANVSSSGDYLLNATFSFNGSSFASTLLTKISRAASFILRADEAVYLPGSTIAFKIKVLDSNGAGITGENVTIRMVYQTNDTQIVSYNGLTDSGGAGELSGTFTAPSAAGTYRLVVNDWLAAKVFDVMAFDIATYTGDADGNVKTLYGLGDTAYIFADLFGANKTKYTNTESIAITVTFPNGTTLSSTRTYSGSRINTTVLLTALGNYSVTVKPASVTKSIQLAFDVRPYELRSTIESVTRGNTNSFFHGESGLIFVKVYNISSGELITSNYSTGVWDLKLLDSGLNTLSTLSNSTAKTASNSYGFSFVTPNQSALYYIRVKLNDTEHMLDFSVRSVIAESTPVDQDYNFQNVFVGNKQVVRIITIISDTSGSINLTNTSVMEVRNVLGEDIKSNLTFNRSIITYKGARAGLVEFTAPKDAGWYFIRVLANGNYVGESWFLVKLYSLCSQLGGYRWFIGSNESAVMTLKVTEAKDIGFIESVAGNLSSSDSGNSSSSFGNMYGVQDCYGAAKTTVSGSTSTGNSTANIRVSVSRVVNTETLEDLTSRISGLPSNTTDNNGQTALSISPPTNGWDSGSYIVEFTLLDQNNNTDKGWGWFTVKNLWINIWPRQYSGYWKWYFSPGENFTFDVFSYNSTATWYYYGQGQGTGDNCTLIGVFYQGDGSEWFWPPREISPSKYNSSCLKSSSGRFNLTISPLSSFKTGYYMLRVRVNATSGISDTGDGWLSIKAYNVYLKTASANYYDSWYKGITDNISFIADIANTNSTYYSCYWSACPASERAAGSLNITVKKIIRYDQWVPKDYAPSKYMATLSNGTGSALNSIITTNGTVNITLTPKTGSGNNSWETGYYSMVLEVSGPEGTETGNSWYEVKSFFVDITPVNANGTQYRSSYRSGENITLNVSAASKPRWMATSYGVNLTYYNTTVTNMKLSYWAYENGRMVTVPVNYTPSSVNGTGRVTIIPSGNLTGGAWYNLEMTLRDSSGNEQTGYASFEIKDFSFSTQSVNWKWEYTKNETIQLQGLVCDTGYWCYTPNTYTGNPVNITVSNIYRTATWPYTSVSGWSSTSGQATSGNSGTAFLNITQTTPFSSGSYAAEISARYADGSGSVQKQNVWFTIKAFAFSANPTKWEFSMRENVTIAITSGKAVNLTSVALTCGYWPNYRTFELSSNLAANTTSLQAGTTVVKLSPSGTQWVNGYCYGNLGVSDGGDTVYSFVNFNIKAFSLSTGLPKYLYGRNESVLLNLTTDNGLQINISAVNITNWANWPNLTRLSNGNGITISPSSITSNGTLNITPTGQWPVFGYYSGELEAYDAANPSATQRAWFSFEVPAPLTAYGYPSDSSGSWKAVNTSNASRSVSFRLAAQKYNPTLGYYQTASGVNVSLLSIEQEICLTYPCSYTSVTDYTSTNATTDSGGIAFINVTKSGLWSYGSHIAKFMLNSSAIPAVVNDTRVWFWVGQG